MNLRNLLFKASLMSLVLAAFPIVTFAQEELILDEACTEAAAYAPIAALAAAVLVVPAAVMAWRRRKGNS